MNAVAERIERRAREGLVKLAEQSAPPLDRFRLLGVNDLHDLPRLTWVIQAVMPATGVAGIYGPSTSGKSFLSLDMVSTLGTGGQWFGHKVKPCRVVYVALEGSAGFRSRVEAWERFHERAFPDAVSFVFDPFDLTLADDVISLAGAIDAAGGAEVVLIDTLNRAAPGADENSSQDMSLILEGTRKLQAMTGGLVVLVHHTGKDTTRGMRGHSSLFAALDAAIEVSRDSDSRQWKVEKAKDGRDGESHPFRLHVIDLGLDEVGEPITSCVVQSLDAPSEHVSAVIQHVLQERAESVTKAAFGRLLNMGVQPTDGKNSPDYLPTQIVDKGLADGMTKADLAAAMNRLMTKGVFVRSVVGQYTNRNPRFGLTLSEVTA